MIVLFFLCIKLAILHFSASVLGYQCYNDDYWWMHSKSKPTIFLINDYGNDYNERLQLNFQCNCWQFYDIQFGSLEEAIKYKYDNIIHFAVLNYSDGNLPKNFEYAGNITKTQEVECNKTGKSEPKFDCHEIANIVSSSLVTLNYGHVYNYVQQMEIINKNDNDCLDPQNGPLKCKPFVQTRPINLTTVVICVPELIHPKKAKNYAPKRTPLTVIQLPFDYCNLDSYNDQLLAVLAPKPFEVIIEYLVPTIFYETPYIFSENQSAFPNSMNVTPWRLLKYGFLKFIQTVGWQRVAIVTDDSEYSLEFENELTALFYKERIVFTVIRCEDINCEMNKIKEELRRVSASIVVANVEAEHAKCLVKYANPRITWIVRDLAGNTADFSNQHVFSISLRAVHQTEGCGDVDDNILSGLNNVALAYKELGKADFELNKREFYRRFANKAKEITTRKTEAIVVVYSGNGAEVSTMYVNGSGAQLLYFKDPFKSRFKPSDGTSHCLATSYDYFKPCEDHILLLFICVVLVFVITFLLVLCYFDKSSPLIDVRYRNL